MKYCEEVVDKICAYIFSRYIMPGMEVEPFHAVYYELLDRFAHGKIKKLIVQMPHDGA